MPSAMRPRYITSIASLFDAFDCFIISLLFPINSVEALDETNQIQVLIASIYWTLQGAFRPILLQSSYRAVSIVCLFWLRQQRQQLWIYEWLPANVPTMKLVKILNPHSWKFIHSGYTIVVNPVSNSVKCIMLNEFDKCRFIVIILK